MLDNIIRNQTQITCILHACVLLRITGGKDKPSMCRDIVNLLKHFLSYTIDILVNYNKYIKMLKVINMKLCVVHMLEELPKVKML